MAEQFFYIAAIVIGVVATLALVEALCYGRQPKAVPAGAPGLARDRKHLDRIARIGDWRL